MPPPDQKPTAKPHRLKSPGPENHRASSDVKCREFLEVQRVLKIVGVSDVRSPLAERSTRLRPKSIEKVGIVW